MVLNAEDSRLKRIVTDRLLELPIVFSWKGGICCDAVNGRFMCGALAAFAAAGVVAVMAGPVDGVGSTVVKTDPAISISYSGTVDHIKTNSDPVYGTLQIHIAWSMKWNGVLSDLISPSGAPYLKYKHFTSVTVSGTWKHLYPAGHGAVNCVGTVAAGRFRPQILPRLDGNRLLLNFEAPLSVRNDWTGEVVLHVSPAGCDDNTTRWSVVVVKAGQGVDLSNPTIVLNLSSGAVEPRTFPINGSSTTEMGAATLKSTLRSEIVVTGKAKQELKVASVQFGAKAVPAIWDRDSGGKRIQQVHVTEATVPCKADKNADWVACTPGGSPNKVWPVIVPRGEKLCIAEVRFRAPQGTTAIVGGVLEGKATIPGGGRLLFKTEGVNLARGKTDLVVKGPLCSTGPLPSRVRAMPRMPIRWTVKPKDGARIDAGTSTHPIYVVLGDPAGADSPFVPFASTATRLISIVDLSTRAADGAGTPGVALDKIWAAFTRPGRNGITRATFDPRTGNVTRGAPLQFWPKGFNETTLFAGTYGAPPPTQNVVGLLHDHVGTCNAFAQLMQQLLAVQRIESSVRGPGLTNFWAPIAYPGADLFLVGSWRFDPPKSKFGTKAFPVVNGIFNAGAGGAVPANLGPPPHEAHFQRAAGQNNSTPASLWRTKVFGPSIELLTADHALLDVSIRGESQTGDESGLYDPSYGHGPFRSVKAWANASIVAYARVVDGKGAVVDYTKCGSGSGLSNVCFLQVHPVR